MELLHALGVCFLVLIGYLFMTRNRGGVKDIGVVSSRELLRHMTIIKDGVTYRPESAEKTREPGMYKVSMYELQNDGRRGEVMPHIINVDDYKGRLGLALVPGELVLEERFDSIAELVDPVLKQRHEDEILKFLESLEYVEIENQLKDAEAGNRDLKKTVVSTRKKMLDYVDLLKNMHRDKIELQTKYDKLTAVLDAYGEAPRTINDLVKANAHIARLSREVSELRSKSNIEAEVVQKLMGRTPDSSVWLLINVDELRDVGKNENKRLLVHNDLTMDPVGSTVNIVANGCSVHPATSDSSTCGKVGSSHKRDHPAHTSGYRYR